MSNPTNKAQLYLVRTLSNLHAGAGDKSFGLIDKHVQRDPTTRLPAVYASSIKGALRETFSYHRPEEKTTRLFGSDNKKGNAAVLQQGKIRVQDARLLALPVRSSHQLYFMATTPELLADFINVLLALDHDIGGMEQLVQLRDEFEDKIKLGNPLIFGGHRGVKSVYLENLKGKRPEEMEGEENSENLRDNRSEEKESEEKEGDSPVDLVDLTEIEYLLGNRIALLHVDDFAALCDDLPTVARNALDNGISENLWYEEIVPRETRFYCAIHPYGLPKPAQGEVTSYHPIKELDDLLVELGYQLQLGANATVGYGQTHWTPLKA